MAYRQRNIPVTSKEECESQTDVRLIESYLLDGDTQPHQSHLRSSTIRLSEVYGSSGLLRPFSDHHLLQQFAREVKQLKEHAYDEKTVGKRLEILEGHIQGLLKRDFLLSGSAEGSQKWKSYYSTLNQKEKDIIRMHREKVYSDLKLNRLQERIDSLEEEVHQLRLALVHSQKAVQENKLYSSFYERINKIIATGNNKGADIQLVFSEQILPVYTEFSINLNNITRIINKDININIRPIVASMAKEFDRLLREQQFNEEKLTETVTSLINNFKAVRGVQYLKSQFDLAQRAQIAQSNYANILTLLNHQIEGLKRDQPNFKGAQRFDWLARKLEEDNIELIQINGWMNLATTHLKVASVGREDTKLRQLIGILAGEFKRVYLKFPELKNHVSAKLIQIFQSQALAELIEGGSIERLREIIVHEIDTIRVDNIYSYENTKDAKLIFNLRVLIKSLFEQLLRVRDKHGIELGLDAGILGLIRQLGIDCINVQEIIDLFRPPARYIEVPVVVENIVYETKHFEKGVPINKSTPIVISQQKLQVVPINKQVPVYIDRPVEHIITNNVPVEIVTEKIVEVKTNVDVIVDRVVEVAKEVQVIRQKSVPLYQREEVVQQVQVDKIIKDIEYRQVEKVVPLKVQQIVEVERVIEKAVVRNEIRENIKEVQVKVPYVITKTDVLQVQRKVPYVIQKEKAVEVRVQVPVEIKVPEITFVEVLQFRDKPVVTNNIIEKPVYVQLKVEKEIVKEVPKQIFIERSHFVKGDKQEVIRQVQVFVDKPIIQQVMITRDLEIEKVVPLYITEQIPVITNVSVPYFTEKVKQIEVDKVKIVPARQEVVKTINVEKPVPIVIEKEVVKVQQQFIDRIVQKIVEVPRVVQVEKIVEKIVVVPRIIQKIVEVPKIVQKIVVVTETVLQIVEIPVPQIIIQEVQVPIQVVVEKTVVVKEKEIEIVEVEKIVEKIVTQQKFIEVQVEKRVPYEVIKEVPVETYRDRIEYQRMDINQTKVETIQVQVPFIVQEKVPFVVEKEVITHEIIQQAVFEKLYNEKEKPVVVWEDKLVVQQVVVEKPITVQVKVQVPGPETIVRLVEPVEVEIIREKLVKEQCYTEHIKEVILEHDKIVPLIHEKIVTVSVNQIVKSPELIQVPKIVKLVHYKEVAVDVPVREERLQTTIVQQIQEIQKKVQVPYQVEISRQQIKQIVKEIKCFITQEVPKEIHTEVEILLPTETKTVEVPSDPIIQQLRDETKNIEVEDRVIERIVEKIVMLPQIVEVVKHIHHISEVNQLGVAVDVDINVQTEKYLGVTTELRKGLVDLLAAFRVNVGRQPDLKNLIIVIQKYLKFIDDWIAFPKLVEIEKQVIREVEKEKVVLVPTANKEREASLCYILQRLLNQLKRIKQSHKITLNLEDDLMRIFFSERRGDDNLDKKYEELQETLKAKYSSFGQWSSSQPFLISSFLQDHFALQSLIQQANIVQKAQSEQITYLRNQYDNAINKYNNILCFNRKMFNDNNALINTLQKYRSSITEEEYEESMKSHRSFYDEIIEGKMPIMISTIERGQHFSESVVVERSSGESSIGLQKDNYIGELVSKVSKYESESQNLISRNKRLQSEITKCNQQLNIRSNIIKRLQSDFESKVSRAREELSKNPNVNKQMIQQNKKLQDKYRNLEKEIASEKQNNEKVKRELQRSVQNLKRQSARQIERKDKQLKDLSERNKREFDREILRLKNDYQKLKVSKERLDDELFEIKKRHSEEIRVIREQQLGGATDKHNELIDQNNDLRKRYDELDAEYQKLKSAAVENNSINERQMSKLKAQIQRYQLQLKEGDKGKKSGKGQKGGFMDLPEETILINKNLELEKRIKLLETDVIKYKSKDDSSLVQIKTLREKMMKLEIELETTRKELQASQKLKATHYQSGIKSSAVGSSEYVVESSIVRSPTGTYFKSAEQKGRFVSPQSVQSRQQRMQEYGSSSSRLSQESSEQKSYSSQYRSQMTLREFLQTKYGEDKEKDVCVIFSMIKIIDEVQREAEKGNYNSYNLSNIYLINFNPKQLDKLSVKFGVQIVNKNKDNDGLYLAPQVLAGAAPSLKAVVFSLGIILDELIHGNTFFRSMEQIQNPQIEFKVRGDKLNPILKNTLFEMMNKEPSKRLDLIQAKRRLSLQKYITTEGKSSITTTQRYQRRREE